MSSDEPSKPSGRRWRGVAVVAGMALILVVAILASAVLFREDLAQAVLRDQLNELGLKDSRFRVEQITIGSISIAEFSAGTAVSFDRLTVGFSASEILRGRVARIEVTGLQVDMTQPGPWAELRRKYDGKNDKGAGSPLDLSVLPIINIRQARLRIDGPAGPMTIIATAHLLPDPEGNLAFQAKASTMGPPGEFVMGFEGTIRVSAEGGARAMGRLSATAAALTVGKVAFKSLKIELPLSVALTTNGATVIVSKGARFETNRLDLETGLSAGPISGSFTGRLTSTQSSARWFDAKADIAIDAHNIRAGSLAAKRIVAAVVFRPEPDGGLAFQAQASAAGPPGKIDMRYDGTIRRGANGGATAAGRLSATSTSLTVGNAMVKSLKIQLPLSVDATTNGVTVTVPKGALFEAKRLDLETGLSTGPISFSLTGRLTSTLSSGGWFDAKADIAVESRNIRAGDLAAKRMTGALAMRVKAGPGTATLNIARGGRLALDGVRAAKNDPVTKLSTLLSGRVSLSWPVGSPSTRNGAGTGPSIDYKLSIVPAPITQPGAPDTHAILGKIETSGFLAANGAYRGRVAMDTGRFTRGSQSLAITSLLTRLTTNAGLAGASARITIGSLRDMSVATVFGAPVSGTYDLTATVRQTGSRLTYQADIGGLGRQRLAAIAGTHDLATRAGHANLSLPVVTLGSDGVQPYSVIPALSIIRKVTGSIGGEARLKWGDQGLNGRARLRLDGIGGETDNATVEGLSGAIVIDTLMPPSTAPGQLLRIRKIDAGAVLTDTSIRFTLLPSGILRIGRAEATLADGKIIIVAPAIDPAAQKAKATVTLEGVQLEKLLNLVDLGDLQASGRIHGFIPIRIRGGKIAIDAGALASLGGGTLRFKSERVKQILKSGGDQVTLMLRALEDFTYERLGVDIDKSMAGNARVTLRTLGHNPAVLRGRKFQINVNLDTNLDRLLDAALEWYRLSGRALRGIFATRTRKGIR